MLGVLLLAVLGGVILAAQRKRPKRARPARKAPPFRDPKEPSRFGFAKHMGPALADFRLRAMASHIDRLTRGRPQAPAFARAAVEARAAKDERWMREILYKAAALGWTVPNETERKHGRVIAADTVNAALAAGEIEHLWGYLEGLPLACLEHGDPIPSGEASGPAFDPIAMLAGDDESWLVEMFASGGTDASPCQAAKTALGAQRSAVTKRFGIPRPPREMAELARGQLRAREGIRASPHRYYLRAPGRPT